MAPRERQLTGGDRQHQREQRGEDPGRPARRKPTGPTSQAKHESDAGSRHHEANGPLEEHIPATHQEERRQDVTIEPGLIGPNRQNDETRAGQYDGGFSDHASHRRGRPAPLTHG
jgi:hypothetical protein